MAMIYGLNYFGSSLVGPTWACAPGMQTLAACRAICAHGERGGDSRAGASLGGGGVTPVGDGRERDCADCLMEPV